MNSVHQTKPAIKSQVQPLLFEGEEIRPVPGHESMYLVTSYGRVFSLNYRNTGKAHELAQSSLHDKRRTGSMYRRAKMFGIQKNTPTAIHRVVALAFLPNPNGFREVNHIDGNKANNHVSNLEWVSASGNQRHAFAEGLHIPKMGESHGMAILTEEQVLKIREELEHATYRGQLVDIGHKYGVSKHCIFDIKRGRSWRHVA